MSETYNLLCLCSLSCCGNGHVSVSASVKQRSACYLSPSPLRMCEYAYPVEISAGLRRLWRCSRGFSISRILRLSRTQSVFYFILVHLSKIFFPFSLLQQSLSGLVPLSKSRLGFFCENKAFIHII